MVVMRSLWIVCCPYERSEKKEKSWNECKNVRALEILPYVWFTHKAKMIFYSLEMRVKSSNSRNIKFSIETIEFSIVEILRH